MFQHETKQTGVVAWFSRQMTVMIIFRCVCDDGTGALWPSAPGLWGSQLKKHGFRLWNWEFCPEVRTGLHQISQWDWYLWGTAMHLPDLWRGHLGNVKPTWYRTSIWSICLFLQQTTYLQQTYSYIHIFDLYIYIYWYYLIIFENHMLLRMFQGAWHQQFSTV